MTGASHTRKIMPYVKRFLYVAYDTVLHLWWRTKGARVLQVMGDVFRVHPHTVFPTYRRLPLPRGHCRSEIVRYADFVQMHACCQYLAARPHPTVVEIGAHHGAYAIVLGKVVQRQAGRLLAVEPNPMSFRLLRHNVALNHLEQTVALEQVAVTEKCGMVDLSLQDAESHLVPRGMPASVEVAGEPLASILPRHGITAVDLLLIDVEGAELPVLRSFPWDRVPVGRILCEMHPYNWASFHYGGADLQEFLAERRLTCLDMYLMEHQSFPGQDYLGPCLLRGPEPAHE